MEVELALPAVVAAGGSCSCCSSAPVCCFCPATLQRSASQPGGSCSLMLHDQGAQGGSPLVCCQRHVRPRPPSNSTEVFAQQLKRGDVVDVWKDGCWWPAAVLLVGLNTMTVMRLGTLLAIPGVPYKDVRRSVRHSPTAPAGQEWANAQLPQIVKGLMALPILEYLGLQDSNMQTTAVFDRLLGQPPFPAAASSVSPGRAGQQPKKRSASKEASPAAGLVKKPRILGDGAKPVATSKDGVDLETVPGSTAVVPAPPSSSGKPCSSRTGSSHHDEHLAAAGPSKADVAPAQGTGTESAMLNVGQQLAVSLQFLGGAMLDVPRTLTLQVQQLLGQGGNAEVYRVQVLGSDNDSSRCGSTAAATLRPVQAAGAAAQAAAADPFQPGMQLALKVALFPWQGQQQPPSAADLSVFLQAARKHLFKEGRMLQEVQDGRHVVSCYGGGSAKGAGVTADLAECKEGLPCLLLQHADRGGLWDMLQPSGGPPRPFTPNEAWEVMSDVAAGLVSLHSKGIIHRDIKSQNIVCTSRPNGSRPAYMLCDMGAACKLGPCELGKGGYFGTPGFRAPEQADGCYHVASYDAYQLGLLLLTCRTAAYPFPPGHKPGSENVERLLASEACKHLLPSEKECIRMCLADVSRRPTVKQLWVECPYMECKPVRPLKQQP